MGQAARRKEQDLLYSRRDETHRERTNTAIHIRLQRLQILRHHTEQRRQNKQVSFSDVGHTTQEAPNHTFVGDNKFPLPILKKGQIK